MDVRLRIGMVQSVDGAGIAYREFLPHAPLGTLLLVHGWGQSSLSWGDELLTRLAATGQHVIAIDLRGHGYSTSGSEQWPERVWAHDLDAVLAHCHYAHNITLVGWSYGGVVVTEFLRYTQHTVNAVVLCGAITSINADGNSVIPTGRFAHDACSEVASTAITALLGAGSSMFTTAAGAAQQRLCGSALLTPPHIRRALLNYRSDNEAFLPQIAIPILVLHGSEDKAVPVQIATWHASAIPGARLHTLPRVGHVPFVEAPEEFVSALHKFIQEVSWEGRT